MRDLDATTMKAVKRGGANRHGSGCTRRNLARIYASETSAVRRRIPCRRQHTGGSLAALPVAGPRRDSNVSPRPSPSGAYIRAESAPRITPAFLDLILSELHHEGFDIVPLAAVHDRLRSDGHAPLFLRP
jgi:hypothetical protein